MFHILQECPRNCSLEECRPREGPPRADDERRLQPGSVRIAGGSNSRELETLIGGTHFPVLPDRRTPERKRGANAEKSSIESLTVTELKTLCLRQPEKKL